MFEFLGNLFENFENPLWSSSLICQVLPKPYDEISWKPHTHMLLVVALSFVKLLWTLWEFFSCFHDQDAVHANILLAMLSWDLALYHLSIPQNEAPHYVLISLSLQVNMDTWRSKWKKVGHMKVQGKKLDTWRSKEKKEKIAMSKKSQKRERGSSKMELQQIRW
jgi:hypothetical protein